MRMEGICTGLEDVTAGHRIFFTADLKPSFLGKHILKSAFLI